ncbi:HNH endonuclease [Streptomyces phage PumpkinSpice]|nr:HNH endonuclease [Streptomyces phage PumpkinSpice]
MKTCSRCKLDKSYENFGKATSNADGLQRWCKQCKSDVYQSQSGKYKESSKAARIRRYEKLMKIKNVPCMDCNGEFPSFVMDFDHVRGEKLADVSDLMQNASWQRVLDEIAKCDIICANCHRIRTHARMEQAKSLV